MKKQGFTLAEILISIAIIGVVAAICVPTLGTGARKQANLATLKVTVSDFENAFSAMMVAEAKDSLFDVEDWSTNDKLSRYIKIDGNRTKNGTEFSISNKTLKLDINGTGNKPDEDGVDIYTLTIDDYGMTDISKYISEN